jgi:hypothetical protein
MSRFCVRPAFASVTKARNRFEEALGSDRAVRRSFEKIKAGLSRFKG